MDKYTNLRIKSLIVWFFLGLFSVKTVLADTANQYLDIAVQAAQQKQYQVALKALLQAKDAGLDSPELNYNLGVVYYNLAQYDKANASFELLTNDPEYSAVAFYNLGLVSLKLGDESGAKANFLKTYSNTDDENLKNLSQRALQRLGVESLEKKSLLAGWGGFVSLNGGYDDNVSLIDEDVSQASGIEDYHLEMFAATNRKLWGSDENGIYFDANVDVLKQQKEHDYDYSQWHLSLAHRGVVNRWNTRARAGIDRTSFGGDDFQQLLSLDLRGQRDFNAKTGIELRYKYVDVKDRSPDGSYDYLAGNRQQLRIRLMDSRNNISFKYSYELQFNDRNDFSGSFTNSTNTATAIITKSYSPLRHSLQMSADIPWGKSMTLSLEAQYRYSYYSDPDTETIIDNATGQTLDSLSVNRKDHRYRLNAGLAYRLTPAMELFADYGFTKNDSNLEGSDYDRTLIRAGLTWFY
ncbi:MAG: hypothetical protein AMJ53_04525 [Gammaproteobacteria bacterium SG8_11]|nr:MAG: hypothetical protein AMJ53_04525 [Gammaproteobacteria bacterium SG8_11]